MKKFLIKILIAFIIVTITNLISNTYLSGGIAGILTTCSSIFIDELYKRLEKVSDR